MGMREEIANLKSVCCGLISRDEVLDIIDKHAAPVVDMTPGGVLRVPLLPINEQDNADLAAILAEHDLKKNRTPL